MLLQTETRIYRICYENVLLQCAHFPKLASFSFARFLNFTLVANQSGHVHRETPITFPYGDFCNFCPSPHGNVIESKCVLATLLQVQSAILQNLTWECGRYINT